jgi:hypothetical protein
MESRDHRKAWAGLTAIGLAGILVFACDPAENGTHHPRKAVKSGSGRSPMTGDGNPTLGRTDDRDLQATLKEAVLDYHVLRDEEALFEQFGQNPGRMAEVLAQLAREDSGLPIAGMLATLCARSEDFRNRAPAWIESRFTGALLDEMRKEFVAALVRFAPEMAQDYVAHLPGDSIRERMTTELLNAVVARDPLQAFQLAAKENTSGHIESERRWALSKAVRGMIEGVPIESLREATAGENFMKLGVLDPSRTTLALSKRDPVLAMEWGMRIENPQQKKAALNALVPVLMLSGDEQRLSSLVERSGGLLSEEGLFENYIGSQITVGGGLKDSQALKSMPVTRYDSEIFRTIGENIYPEANRQWIDSMDEGPRRDYLLRGIVEQLVRQQDSGGARDWADKIKDPLIRQEALSRFQEAAK